MFYSQMWLFLCSIWPGLTSPWVEGGLGRRKHFQASNQLTLRMPCVCSCDICDVMGVSVLWVGVSGLVWQFWLMFHDRSSGQRGEKCLCLCLLPVVSTSTLQIRRGVTFPPSLRPNFGERWSDALWPSGKRNI